MIKVLVMDFARVVSRFYKRIEYGEGKGLKGIMIVMPKGIAIVPSTSVHSGIHAWNL